MIDGVQKVAKALGAEGCYFLSLLKIAEEITSHRIDPLGAYVAMVKERALRSDCYVLDAAAILTTLTCQEYGVLKAGPGHTIPLSYTPTPAEREILRFERPNPAEGEAVVHFAVGDGSGRVAWDPWPGSETSAKGALVSKRIIRRKS
jgi:hypothetical protein